MDDKLIKEIVEAEDERNYLRNILEYADATEQDVYSVILEKIDYLQNKLDQLQK